MMLSHRAPERKPGFCVLFAHGQSPHMRPIWLSFFAVAGLALVGPVSCSSDGEPTATSSGLTSLLTTAPTSQLTIESYTENGILCYQVLAAAGVAVSTNCPEIDLSKGELVWGETAMDDDGRWYAVVWVAPYVPIVDASSPFSRSDGGWTVFHSATDIFFWFDVTNLGASFHCTVESFSIKCSMVSAP